MSLLKSLCPDTWDLGKKPTCNACAAGGLISFRWTDSMNNLKIRPALDAFEFSVQLRSGKRFNCKICGQPWYLDQSEEFMNFLPRARLPLVQQWNANRLTLTQKQLSELASIGRTPPDIYGNGRRYHETPCSVITKSGECIELAVVSQQSHAPFEEYRINRLASDIDTIYPSAFALPLDIRVACSQADEISMGFCPTRIQRPDGKFIILDGRENFFVSTSCKAADLRLIENLAIGTEISDGHVNQSKITYFVADLHEA